MLQKLQEKKLQAIPKLVKSFLLLIVLTVAVIALYEFVYNFVIWSSLITESVVRGVLNLDRLNVPYPNLGSALEFGVCDEDDTGSISHS